MPSLDALAVGRFLAGELVAGEREGDPLARSSSSFALAAAWHRICSSVQCSHDEGHARFKSYPTGEETSDAGPSSTQRYVRPRDRCGRVDFVDGGDAFDDSGDPEHDFLTVGQRGGVNRTYAEGHLAPWESESCVVLTRKGKLLRNG